MEMWHDKLVDYSPLHVFGCPVYVMYSSQERMKLDPKSIKCIFLGYADDVQGYRLWDPIACKVIINRDVIFADNELHESKNDSTSKETIKIQMDKKYGENDSSEAEPKHEEQEPDELDDIHVRRLSHQTKVPSRFSDYVMANHDAYCLLTEEGEPSNFQEAIRSSDVSLWMTAMQEEIEVLHRNKTWKLLALPEERKAIGNKWVYKIKRNSNDQVERYRARLVVKGYAQKEGIDFKEIFSPVVRFTTIRVVLAMCATFNLHLEQLDVKIAFLHGELEEEICMLQPKGFDEQGKENLVCRLTKSLYRLKQAPIC